MTELAGVTLYTTEEISEFLGISKLKADQFCRERRIEAKKVGKSWRVTKEALEKYLKVRR